MIANTNTAGIFDLFLQQPWYIVREGGLVCHEVPFEARQTQLSDQIPDKSKVRVSIKHLIHVYVTEFDAQALGHDRYELLQVLMKLKVLVEGKLVVDKVILEEHT